MGQVFFRIKPFSATGLARAYGMVAGTLLPGLAFAGPGGGQVIAGQAGITTPDAHTTVIRQQSQNAVINWQQFSVGSNEFVLFNQPSASAAVLNRVVGGLPSEILGNLSANGRVFLVNPQGVLFGEGARVDVGGLVASTLDIRKQDFMNGRYRFVQGTASPAEVANEGRIKTGPGGFVVLAADRVENSGLIQANGGDVLLASGSRMTLTMDADGLVGYSIDAAALSGQAGIDNVGDIVANGGTVVLDASVAQGLIGNVINNRGRITARSVEERDGAIYLLAEGGDIENSGSLDASGIAAADGGRVVLRTDQNLSLTDSGVIRADGGRSGDGGMIRLIAEGDAHTAAGSLISAHAGARGERGGAVELSGHASLSVRGAVDVGRGGRLLIDPSVVNIADGAGASSSTGGVATVFEQFIEGQLQSGADVAIVADDRITLESLVDGTLDGRNAGLGGSLTVGIGIVSGSGSTANGVFVDGPPPIGFSFFPGPGGSSAGGIFFQNLGNAIRVDGRLQLSGGTSQGLVLVGDLEGSDIDISSAESIDTGNITLTGGGNVVVSNTGGGSAGTGDIALGSIDAAGAAVVNIQSRNSVTLLGSLDAGAAIVTVNAGAVGGGSLTALDINGDEVRLLVTDGNLSVGAVSANGGFASSGDVDIDVSGGAVIGLGPVTLSSAGKIAVFGEGGVQADGDLNAGAASGQIEIIAQGGALGLGAPGAGIRLTGDLQGFADFGATLNAHIIQGRNVDLQVRAFGGPAADLTIGQLNISGDAFLGNASGGGLGGSDIIISGAVQTGGEIFIRSLHDIDIQAAGELNAGGQVTLGGDNDIFIRGQVVAGSDMLIGALGDISGAGAINAGGDLSLFAGSSEGLVGNIAVGNVAGRRVSLNALGNISAGTINATGLFATSGDIDINAFNLGPGTGNITSLGAMTLSGAGSIAVYAEGSAALTGDINAGGAAGRIEINARGGTLALGTPGAGIRLTGDLRAFADLGAALDANIVQGGDVELFVRAFGGPAANMTVRGLNVSGNVLLSNTSGSGAGASDIIISGLAQAGGMLEVRSLRDINVQAAGELEAGGDLLIHADRDLVVNGALDAAGNINADALRNISGSGPIDAGLDLTMFAGSSGGSAGPGSVGNLDVGNVSGRRVSLNAFGNLSTGTIGAMGRFATSGDVDINAFNVAAGTGNITGLGDITLTGAGEVAIFAEGSATVLGDINAGGVTGLISVEAKAGSLQLGSAGTAVNLVGTLTVLADSGAALDANIGSGQDVTLLVRTFGGSAATLTVRGMNVSGDALLSNNSGGGLGGSDIVIAGLAHAGGDLTVTSLRDINLQAAGRLDAGTRLDVGAGRDVNNAGALTAAGNVDVGALRNVGGGGVMTAAGDLTVFAGNSGGAVGNINLGNVSGRRVSLNAFGNLSTGTIQATGAFATSGDVDINAFNVAPGTGNVTGLGDINLSGPGLVAIYAEGGVTLLNDINAGGAAGQIEVNARGGLLQLGSAATALNLTGELAAFADFGSALEANIGGGGNVTLQLRAFGGPAADMTVRGINVSGNVLLSNTSGSGAGASDMIVSGLLHAGGDIEVRAIHDVRLQAGGTLDAGRDLLVQSRNVVSASGLSQAGRDIAIDALHGVTGSGGFQATGDLSLFGGSSQGARGDLLVGNLSGANVRLTAFGDLRTGTIDAGGGFATSGDVDINVGRAGALGGNVLGLGAVRLTGAGLIDISADGGINLQNRLDAGGPTGQVDLFARGSGATLRMGSATSGIDVVGHLSASAQTGAALFANLSSGTDVDLQVQAFGGPAADMTVQGINVSGNVFLSNASGGGQGPSDILIAGLAHAGGNLDIRSIHDIRMQAGARLEAGGDLEVRADNIMITSGLTQAGGNIDIGVLHGISGGGGVQAGGNLTVFAGDSAGAIGGIALGDVSAAQVGLTAFGGGVQVGRVTATQDLQLRAVDGSVAFGDLAGANINVSFDQASVIGSGTTTIRTPGEFDMNGARLSGGVLDVQATSVLIDASLDFTGLLLGASDFLVLGAGNFNFASFDGTAATISVNGSSFTGGRLTLVATQLVSDNGVASNFDVNGLGIQGAAEGIDLRNSSIHVGTGAAAIGGDAATIAALAAGNPELAPASARPNASFIGSSVVLGGLTLDGDHLYIQTDRLGFEGPISAPLDLLVQLRPFTAGAELGIETASGNSGRQIALGRDDHFNVFPGTTFVLGGSGYTGNIFIGEGGVVDLTPRSTNFVLVTGGSVTGQDQLISNGTVVVLAAPTAEVPFETPLLDEFKPELPGGESVLSSSSSMTTEESEEESEEGEATAEATDPTGEPGDEVEEKTAPDSGQLECS